MDHRWDHALGDARAARAEQERFERPRITRDPDVERRDREAAARRRTFKSPWDIGAAHWDQRDLYTRNARVDDAGYGRGPRIHPEVGSYAYPRDGKEHGGDHDDLAFEHERAAFPWANYPVHEARARAYREREDHGFLHGIKEKVAGALGMRSHVGRGPANWKRPDATIREDVCERLAYHGELDASDVDVLVRAGEVTLEGTVTDRSSKRLAEDIVADVRGVIDVHNRLRVRHHDDTDDADFAMQLRTV
jgi:hypothetical protein